MDWWNTGNELDTSRQYTERVDYYVENKTVDQTESDENAQQMGGSDGFEEESSCCVAFKWDA